MPTNTLTVEQSRIRRTDADAPIAMWTDAQDTPLMRFWRELNEVFARHGIPEVLYGEARDLYDRRSGGRWA